MKKFLLLLSIICVSIISITHFTYAAEGDTEKEEDVLGMDFNIVTYTSEPCGLDGNQGYCTGSGQMKRCKCTVAAGTGFMTFISEIYRYVFFISLIIGVLMIVYLGIAMSLSGIASEEMKSNAKKKIFEIMAGLGALGLMPFILKTVAPFFFQ